MRLRKITAAAIGMILTAVLLFQPLTLTKVQAAESTRTVEDALEIIYKSNSDVLTRDFNQATSKLLKKVYSEVLAGMYSKNAVACFLDHNLFTNHYDELAEAGLLPDDYELPDNPYTITRTDQQLEFTEDGDAVTRYVLVTDSIYLQTYQLLQISEIHAFDQTADYEAELESYDDTYVYKINSAALTAGTGIDTTVLEDDAATEETTEEASETLSEDTSASSTEEAAAETTESSETASTETTETTESAAAEETAASEESTAATETTESAETAESEE